MKTSLSLEYRLTHHYVQGWASLDKYAYACLAQHTLLRTVRGRNDLDSSTSACVVTVSPLALEAAKANYREAKRHHDKVPTFSQFLCLAVGEAFSGGCRCEFDCCGHWQYNGSASQTKRREFVVTIHGYRNV